MTEINVTLEQHPSAELTLAIRKGLIAFNEAHAGAQSLRQYALLVRDDHSNVLGGLIADEHWGWLYIGWLWLPEDLRGRGLGRRLLLEAESISVANGCRNAYLSTFEFQAMPFYQRHGYKVWGTLDDYPAGSGFSRYYLRKQLVDAEN
jgi:ribosomal protein S18 acetylase RimI-like enzyme